VPICSSPQSISGTVFGKDSGKASLAEAPNLA
jgi:hypothetical protein